MSYGLPLADIATVADNIHHLVFERPNGFEFTPGQAVDLALDRDGWRDETRPFTMTSLPEADQLEFLIKEYPDHDGVTHQIGHLRPGAYVTLSDPWGALHDRGDGLFIAGGMGITPWLAILRQRQTEGTLKASILLYGVERQADLVAIKELEAMPGLTVVLAVSEDPKSGQHAGHIDKALVSSNLPSDGPVYLCGPPPMEDAIAEDLQALGVAAGRLVREE